MAISFRCVSLICVHQVNTFVGICSDSDAQWVGLFATAEIPFPFGEAKSHHCEFMIVWESVCEIHVFLDRKVKMFYQHLHDG